MKRLMLTTAFLLLALVIKAQTVISGKVTDLNGQPLAHVSVMVEGTEVQTVTNEDGQFTLKMHEQADVGTIYVDSAAKLFRKGLDGEAFRALRDEAAQRGIPCQFVPRGMVRYKR